MSAASDEVKDNEVEDNEVEDEEGLEEGDDEELEEAVEDEDALAGEEAITAATELMMQRLAEDEAFTELRENCDDDHLIQAFHFLFMKVFDDEEWPKVSLDSGTIDECYEDFAGALTEAISSPDFAGAEAISLVAGMAVLTDAMIEDERMQRIIGVFKGTAVKIAEASEAGEQSKAVSDSTGQDVNTTTFDDLVLEESVVGAANEAWKMFISAAESREAAGEAIYAALFESAPSLQNLFVTPRAVQAMRFMNGIQSFVQALDDPPKLKILVETLGFGHLHLDVTPPRVVLFRDAILDLFIVELAERFTTKAREGFRRLLNYVGGAIIYVKTNYAERITTLGTSWKKANHGAEEEKTGVGGQSSSHDEEVTKQQDQKKAASKKSMFGGSNKKAGAVEGGEAGSGAAAAKDLGNVGAQQVPTTYPEMFMFNAAVMGFGSSSAWMNEVLDCFHNIVTNVSNSARLQEECDIMALRIAKVNCKTVNLSEYKSCMLASLRSLLPKDWDSAHEVAWTWLWDNVERLVQRLMGKPAVWEKALGITLGSYDEEQKYEFRKDIYTRFFLAAPAGQDFFKQSNTYLHIVADKIMGMTLELFRDPVKMVDDVSALGLRHVGYAIPTELFGPFVSAAVEVMMSREANENSVESFRWSLGLISKMLVRTILEGSTIVMKAINQNSQKLLRKAIGCAPRGERAAWTLIVQVGTQRISPLAWSVEAGNFEAAVAILDDLLTFRADRDRYYYGMEDLFKRHPDIVGMLCDAGADLLPKLLDGLIWRSRTTENGMRRVNYYVKHLITSEDGQFSKTLQWVTATKDPKLVCHPVIVLVADIIWSKVAYRTFLFGKSWLFFTVVVFVFGQSVFEHLWVGEVDYKGVEALPPLEFRVATFGCRAFVYMLSMTQLLFSHTRDTINAYRTKSTTKVGCFRLPSYLRQWQEAASFCLTICLLVMFALEPILHCWTHAYDDLFVEKCPEKEDMRYPYTVFSMLAMFLYYVLLIDLTVVSTRISSFTLVCVKMLSEVALFLGAIVGTVLTFASACSVLKQDDEDFAGIPKGAYALFRILLGAFDAARYHKLEQEPVLLFMVFLFGIVTVIFFMSMLVAQLSCAYSAVYEDMVGYARLERAETIVEIIPLVPKKRWTAFVDSLRLHKRLEFNQGDIGVAGGIQMREAANLHPTTVDAIRRYGGSTSADVQWPEDEADGDGDDRFEKIEKLIQKTLQRITKQGGRKGGTGTGTGTGSNTGSGTGTKQSGSGSGSSNNDED